MRIVQKIYGSFLPIPEKQGFAFEFLNILKQAGYIMPVVSFIMTVAGILLLSNKGVNLGLLILLPVTFNIFFFHLFHDRSTLVVAWALFALNNFFIVKRFKHFKPLLNEVN